MVLLSNRPIPKHLKILRSVFLAITSRISIAALTHPGYSIPERAVIFDLLPCIWYTADFFSSAELANGYPSGVSLTIVSKLNDIVARAQLGYIYPQ